MSTIGLDLGLILFKICFYQGLAEAHLPLKNQIKCPALLSIAKIESNFNPKAIGTSGDFGLFQIKTKYWGLASGMGTIQQQVGGALGVINNVRAACEKLLQKNADKYDYLVCYNLGKTKGRRLLKSTNHIKTFEKGPYMKKFYASYAKFRKQYCNEPSCI